MTKLEKFLTLSSEDKRLLSEAVTRVETIDKDQEIISQDERPDHVHLILDGWICRYKYLEQGKRAIMAYLIPGDMCDVHITLLDHMDHSVRSLTPVKVAYLPRETLERFFQDNTTLARAFFWAALVEESTLREWFVNVTSRPADKRLAHLFCEMQVRHRAAGLTQGNSIDFPLTQNDLADAMGITPVHTNRVLQRLRREGMVAFGNKRMTIHDWEGLKAFAEFDLGYLHLSEDILDK
ncbi:Crp/Fnr family transcriptional regulator [Halomonas sp. WWR20]